MNKNTMNTINAALSSPLASADPALGQFAMAQATSDLFKRIFNK